MTTKGYGMEADLLSVNLNKGQFEKISTMLYDLCGIKLGDGKEDLVKARLTKRLRALHMRDFEEYLHYLQEDSSGTEITSMIDMLTTNKTSFFREDEHFDFLRSHVLPNLAARNRIRIWSAGCSTGEEPYTLAMILREEMKQNRWQDVKILATDISTRVLSAAKEGIYEADTIKDVPQRLVSQYFSVEDPGGAKRYRAKQEIRGLISFARLNLMESWPMKGPFDAIFCRNVMIYFDKPTQQRLIERFWKLIDVGGHLFVGHSESLASSQHQFRYASPAVYVKTGS